MPADVHHITHPLIQHKLTLMRQKDRSTNSFRRLLNEISMLMAYEVTRDMPTQLIGDRDAARDHALAGDRRQRRRCSCPSCAPAPASSTACCGGAGARASARHRPVPRPEDAGGGRVLLQDAAGHARARRDRARPMLATGNSAVAAVDRLKETAEVDPLRLPARRARGPRQLPRQPPPTCRSTPRPSTASSTSMATSCPAWATRATGCSAPVASGQRGGEVAAAAGHHEQVPDEVAEAQRGVEYEEGRRRRPPAGQQPASAEASSAATPGSAASAAHQPSSRYRPVDRPLREPAHQLQAAPASASSHSSARRWRCRPSPTKVIAPSVKGDGAAGDEEVDRRMVHRPRPQLGAPCAAAVVDRPRPEHQHHHDTEHRHRIGPAPRCGAAPPRARARPSAGSARRARGSPRSPSPRRVRVRGRGSQQGGRGTSHVSNERVRRSLRIPSKVAEPRIRAPSNLGRVNLRSC